MIPNVITRNTRVLKPFMSVSFDLKFPPLPLLQQNSDKSRIHREPFRHHSSYAYPFVTATGNDNAGVQKGVAWNPIFLRSQP
jgi:hypothetical protein